MTQERSRSRPPELSYSDLGQIVNRVGSTLEDDVTLEALYYWTDEEQNPPEAWVSLMNSLEGREKRMVRLTIGFVRRARSQLPSQEIARIETLGDLRGIDPEVLKELVPPHAGKIGENRAIFLNEAFKRQTPSEKA